MKQVILILLVLGALLYFYTGSESSTPSYYVAELEVPRRTATYEWTVIEKLKPDQECQELISADQGSVMVERVVSHCSGCRVLGRNCSANLSAEHERAFANVTLDTPYFSYEKGGILPQQDFRIMFSGVTKEEAAQVCVDMRKLLDADLLFFVGGPADCIREPGVL